MLQDNINCLNTKSIFLSIIGEPNVGKSSLLNMAIGFKASIVSPKPQTTRNRINGILTDEDTQIVFTDVPGFLKSKTTLDSYMEKEIYDTMSGSEACLHVVAAGAKFSSIDEKVISKIKNLNIPSILVINKIDLLKNKSLLIEQIKKFMSEFEYFAVVPMSVKTGYGKDALICEIKKLAAPSLFYFPEGEVTDQTDTKVISERIREKILNLLNEEVPHGIAVNVDHIERCKRMLTIYSSVYCEKSSHKRIIIGKRGSMLKNIGIYAREDLEHIFKKKINLKIWVKVKENWKNKESLLRELGYSF